MNVDNKVITVVIPCYKVKKHVLQVLRGIGPEVSYIIVVDDQCPEDSGKLVEAKCKDDRVRVLYHEENQGVGGATMSGYKEALKDGADIVIKIDGDGQMDPSFLTEIVKPVVEGVADYSKGNRFYHVEDVLQMPFVRKIGNAILSFITKISSGYWNIFDPTNGYTAIHARVISRLPLDKIDKRYFFESDMLFRLNILRAVVRDVPMKAVYGDEKSNLKIVKVLFEFSIKNLRNTIKRIFYNYYLRDFNVASLEILLGPVSLGFGVFYGLINWFYSTKTGIPATSGTVMLSALPILIGVQFILSFLNYDIKNTPNEPLQSIFNE